jgi:hypothetical protein
MKAIVIHPGQAPFTQDIPNTRSALQAEVGGYIETVSITTGVVALVDEEGKLKRKPMNVLGLVGTVVLVGFSGAGFKDVPDGAMRLFLGDKTR